MNSIKYIEKLERAIMDLLDGNFENDIQSFSGCNKERSIELRQLFNEVVKNYYKTHKL